MHQAIFVYLSLLARSRTVHTLCLHQECELGPADSPNLITMVIEFILPSSQPKCHAAEVTFSLSLPPFPVPSN